MRYKVLNPLLRFYLLFLLGMVPAIAFARGARTEAGVTCNSPDCARNSNNDASSMIIHTEGSELAIARLVTNAIDDNQFMKGRAGNACGLFASDRGLGSVGDQIFQAAETYPALMEGPSDLDAICPRFRDSQNPMSKTEKSGFYVLLLNTIAIPESSCNPRASNPGATDGTGYGLFQLLKNHEASSGGSACVNGDSLDPVRSARCAISILNYQVVNHGKLFVEGATQWQVLHPREPKHTYVAATLSNYGPCQHNSEDPNLSDSN